MANKKVAISAGHGRNTAGKRCLKSIDAKETREWVLNARIAEKVTAMLNGYNIDVVRLDDPTGDTDVSLAKRAKKANDAGVNLYIAIHHNAGINGGSGGGIMVFYYPKGTNKTVATKLYNAILKLNGLKGNRSTPISETTKLYEVKTPKALSLLIENGFMDSTTDTPIILTEDYATKSARGIANFIIDYLGLVYGATTTTTETATETVNAGVTYTVKKGDTLTAIARKYGTTVNAIANLNGLANPSKIYVGQTLKIR